MPGAEHFLTGPVRIGPCTSGWTRRFNRLSLCQLEGGGGAAVRWARLCFVGGVRAGS